MPLIILGLLLLIGLLAYSIVRYINSGEEDTRPVRERYPKAFRAFSGDGESDPEVSGEPDDDEPIHAAGYVDIDSLRGDIDHMVRNIKEAVTEKAMEHGIDLSKWGRDPLDHNPFHSSRKDKEQDKDNGEDADEEDGDSTIIFPTDNVEAEKTKRNIH